MILKLNRRQLAGIVTLPLLTVPAAAGDGQRAQTILARWYKLVLELVRHTATYSPPVAARAFAYLGIVAYEAIASGDPKLQSLAGQVTDLNSPPRREPDRNYDDAILLQSALAAAVEHYFSNTGPTGQRAIKAVSAKLATLASQGIAPIVVAASQSYGQAIADHVYQWSLTDGGADIENLGFPDHYTLTKGPAHWVPTSTIGVQQSPLLPDWGKVRSFAMPKGAACPLPPPPDYSEDKTSEFYRQALETCETVKSITLEQKAIARFWSDDPMLSPTPPGHWISIALQIFERDSVPPVKQVDVLARLGIAIADAFIACWQVKFQYDLVRPVTYIKRVIDPKWEPLLITPPFPEYPSGHSTQSGAAATVLTKLFGEDFAFDDATHIKDGIAPRHFKSFNEAASEAAISRLYGGIHFRAAIERGLDQGHCVGAFVNALRTV